MHSTNHKLQNGEKMKIKTNTLKTTLIIAYILVIANILPLVNCASNAYFTSIKVTDKDGVIELLDSGIATVYEGQTTWLNLTFYNEEIIGEPVARFYTKTYKNDALIRTSNGQSVPKGFSGTDNWSFTSEDYGTQSWTVELWWDESFHNPLGTQHRVDVQSFQIKVVKVFVTDWSQETCTVKKESSTPSTLYVSFRNGGNDYMYNTQIVVTESMGLNITPTMYGYWNVPSGSEKFISFSVAAPASLETGSYNIPFIVIYQDFAQNDFGDEVSAMVEVVKQETEMSLNLNPSNVKVDSTVTLTATLIDEEQNPIPGQTVDFSIGSNSIGQATTNSSGNAVLNYVADLDAGSHQITASFTGGDAYEPCTATENLTVTQLGTTIEIDVASSATVNNPVTITAILTDENDNFIAGGTVAFYLYESGSWNSIGSATTNLYGAASIEHTFTVVGNYQLKASYSRSTNYAESNSDVSTMQVNSAATTAGIDYTPYLIGVGGIAVALIVVFVVLWKKKLISF